LYILSRNASKQTLTLKDENARLQTSINTGEKDIIPARNLQAQLKNMQTLLNGHVYWSSFFSQLGAVTPLKAEYTSFNGGISDGRVRFEGVAPSYTDVGKVLLSLSTSGKFSNVRLISVNPSAGEIFGYAFTVEATALNPLFKKTP
jgi:Tfp pilus assembly protein PilN